jgi:Na+:H+ antiporter
MDRIDFFGAALFVPVFLVSVGLLLKPSVMVEGETLGLAALFIVACMSGKLAAALLTRPLMKATTPQALLAFALTAPQAAATLAATTVGFDIGLFDESVVNAVLVLILVSVVVSTLVAEREKGLVAPPAHEVRELGEHVLVAVGDLDEAPLGLRLARMLARPLGGTIEVILLEPPGESRERRARLDRLSGLCRRLSVDTDPTVRVTDHPARTAVLAANDVEASLLLAVGDGEEQWADTVALVAAAPVVIVRGTLDRSLRTVRLITRAAPKNRAGEIATEIADAIPSTPHQGNGDGDGLAAVHAGEVLISAVSGWATLAETRPQDQSGAILVPEALAP